MNRREMLASVGLVSVSALAGQAAPPSAPESDPWVGTYLKLSRYDTRRKGQFGEAQHITITKTPAGYSLGDAYPGSQFRVTAPGILSDDAQSLGRIIQGTVEFADGKKSVLLRAEFCYEDFLLNRIS